MKKRSCACTIFFYYRLTLYSAYRNARRKQITLSEFGTEKIKKSWRCGGVMVYYFSNAPIAQGIEHRSPEPGAQVRFLLGAP